MAAFVATPVTRMSAPSSPPASRRRATLHPFLRALIDTAGPALPFSEMSVEQVRAQARRNAPTAPAPVTLASVRDLSIPGPGGELPVRIYRPQGAGPQPVMVFFHGGGFVVLDLDSHDYLCQRLAAWAGCVVVSVDYRLAPEHKFPAGVDDALAATRWAAAQAESFGGDPARLAVAGVSAGACLAAVAAQRARDEGGPALAAQLLFYPVTNHPTVLTASYLDYGQGHGLTAAQMQWFWAQYLPDAASAADPQASPLRMAWCAGLPPAYLMLAECDLLCDEGAAFAQRLGHAGVETTTRWCAGMNHSFLKHLGALPEADQALTDACNWARERLHRSPAAAPECAQADPGRTGMPRHLP